VKERGNIENLPGSGCRRKMTPLDDIILYQSITKNRCQTPEDVTSRFNARRGCNVSTRTLSRRSFDDGYNERCLRNFEENNSISSELREKIHWTVDNH
jgi:hypothetical protein